MVLLLLANYSDAWLNYGMTGPNNPVDDWFDRRKYTLDLAGLSDEEREEGSIYLGGSAKKFVMPGDKFAYNEVREVVFDWGDPKAADIFAIMLEHDDRPETFDPDLIENELIPFGASTRLRNDLWSLIIQKRGFNPSVDYRSPGHFIEIPYDAEQGYQALHEAMAKPRPGPQMIGKVGLAWVLFEGGTSLLPLTVTDIEDHEERARHFGIHKVSEEPPMEEDDMVTRVLQALDSVPLDLEKLFGDVEIPVGEFLKYAEKLIKDWDFTHASPAENIHFTAQMTHWLLETFAQKDDNGELHLYPHSETHGFKGDKLPATMHHIVEQMWGDIPHLANHNELLMESDHQFFKEEGSLPESVKDMPLKEQVQFLKDNPAELAKVKASKYTHLPQVKMTLRPESFNGWDLEFKIHTLGIEVMPIIDNTEGTTAVAAFQYAVGVAQRPAELAQTACELALLAAQSTNHVLKGTLPVVHLDILRRRLDGDELIPAIRGRRIPS